jgi:hypothetical protein
MCSTKEIYKVLSSANRVQLPQQGSRSINAHASQILKRAWKIKNLSPLMKTFTWRLIRNAITTTERAGRYSQIPRHCSTCDQLETDSHLFLHCQLPTQVWCSFNPPILTQNIAPEHDGIQQSLLHLTPQHTTDNTLWYIWKARNDSHFNRKQ